tara:strand:+ start:493 stop:639 length:147 start_codon:yes stop_codon:yes gene_type:complete
MKKLLFTMSALFFSVTGFAQLSPLDLQQAITFDIPELAVNRRTEIIIH